MRAASYTINLSRLGVRWWATVYTGDGICVDSVSARTRMGALRRGRRAARQREKSIRRDMYREVVNYNP